MKNMTIRLCFVCLSAFLFFLSGCASSVMMSAQRIDSVESDYAMVTFARPAVYLGDGISFGIWDEENFVGVLTAGSYIQYITKPGKHIFMARAENWSILNADLKAGKHYVVAARIFPGIMTGRVALTPANLEDRETIDKWFEKLKPTTVNLKKADAYIQPHLKDIQKAIENVKSGKTTAIDMESSNHL